MRLDATCFWKGIGNVALLSPAAKLLSLRISRKVAVKELPRIVARMGDAVKADYTIISGFISPGEKAVRDGLLEDKAARFIHVLPSCMKNGHRPDSRYLQSLAEGRFLEMAKGNDESAFGRGACLSLNDEIAAMAKAGEGGSLYWRESGPQFTVS